MGTTISRVAKKFGFLPQSRLRILMVGLDGSGKTTILYKLKLGDLLKTKPTIGFNVETIDYNNICFDIWDIGGESKIRPLWKHYFLNAQGVIFVVDSSDRERISEARNELHWILADDNFPLLDSPEDPKLSLQKKLLPYRHRYKLLSPFLKNELANAALLVFANKQDLPNAMTSSEVADKLGLHCLGQRPWYIQNTSANSGRGLYEGLDWLSNNISITEESCSCNHIPDLFSNTNQQNEIDLTVIEIEKDVVVL